MAYPLPTQPSPAHQSHHHGKLVLVDADDPNRARRVSSSASSSTSVLEAAGWTSDAEVRGLVEAERLRIARELHDVVSYSFATINVQASAAAHVMDDRPEQVAEALRAIKAVSAEAARELRAILGVLRRVDDEEAERPSQGLSRLDGLAATVTSAGLPTQIMITGRPRPVPTVVDLTAYRIVQEALTNALRHAGAASASISIRYRHDRVTVEVVDDGCGCAGKNFDRSAGRGHGIAGMRERALAVGGWLEAGQRRLGGFRVSASLPLRDDA
jgi:signal transduction histidine kinase